MEKFQTPVVLFIFKRINTTIEIIERLKACNVAKIYLIGDGPRNNIEEEAIRKCREEVEKRLDWGCEVVSNYASKNRGIYENIGMGAAWVFQREQKAIFLEDDNLPEISFFRYCEELLDKYEEEESVLWINGTNYLGKFCPKDGSSYMFTKHLLPCGWASWSKKYQKYYDGELNSLNKNDARRKFRLSYDSHLLYRQQLHSICTTKRKLELGLPVSWDFQMCYSIRANEKYGISPSSNQIKNIGVDDLSTHGGNSTMKEMTKRFCGMGSAPLLFPLKHPDNISIDTAYEKRITKLMLWPFKAQIAYRVCYLIKPFLRMNKYDSMSLRIKQGKRK